MLVYLPIVLYEHVGTWRGTPTVTYVANVRLTFEFHIAKSNIDRRVIWWWNLQPGFAIYLA